MRVDPTMPAEIMLRGSGVPLIEAEMLLAGGKAEGLPGGGQHHCALAPAQRTIASAGTVCVFRNLKTHPATMAPAFLDGHSSDIHAVHFQMGRHSLSQDKKTLTDNFMTINPKTGLCRQLFY